MSRAENQLWQRPSTGLCLLFLALGLAMAGQAISGERNAKTEAQDRQYSQNFCPVWSPATGEKIAFLSNFDGKQLVTLRSVVYVVNADGTGLKKISGLRGGGCFAWSPDESQIVLADDNGNMVSVNPDGKNPKTLANSFIDKHTRASYGEFCFSPDGKKIAFIKNIRSDYSDTRYYPNACCIFELDTGRQYNLVQGSQSEYISPVLAWSPDSKQLAYVQDEQTFISDVNSKTSRSLIKRTTAQNIVWSLNGDRLFMADERQIVSVDTAKGGCTALGEFTRVQEGIKCTSLCLSPCGTKLLFGFNKKIQELAIGKGVKANIVAGNVKNANSYWAQYSPDGKRVVYVNNDDIWTVGSDGSNPTQVASFRSKQIAAGKETAQVLDK